MIIIIVSNKMQERTAPHSYNLQSLNRTAIFDHHTYNDATSYPQYESIQPYTFHSCQKNKNQNNKYIDNHIKNSKHRRQHTDPQSISSSSHMQQQDKDIQFMYQQLKHQFNALQNQYSLYTQEALQKVSQLEEQMDCLLGEKESVIKQLKLTNQNLTHQSQHYKLKTIHLQQSLNKLQTNYNTLQSQQNLYHKHQTLTSQISSKKSSQKLNTYKNQLSLNKQSIQTLKDILNQQRLTTIDKQNHIINMQNQNARLAAQIKYLNQDLDVQLQNEEKIKDTNYKLKKELEELKILFEQLMISQSKNKLYNSQYCDKCQQLQMENRQLSRQLRQLSHVEQKNKQYSTINRRQSLKSQNRTKNYSINKSRIDMTDMNSSKLNQYNSVTSKRSRYQGGNYYQDNNHLDSINSEDTWNFHKYNKNNNNNMKENIRSFDTLDPGNRNIRKTNKYHQTVGRMSQVKQSIVFRCKKIVDHL